MRARISGLKRLWAGYDYIPEDLRKRVRGLADREEFRGKSVVLFYEIHEQLKGQVLLNVVEFGKWDGNSDDYHAKRVSPAVSHMCQYDHPQRVDTWKWFPDYLNVHEDPSEFKCTVYCAIEGEDIDPKYLS